MRAFIGSSLSEDHRLMPVQQHTALAVPLYRASEHLAFGVAALRGQVFDREAVVHAGDILFDDRPFVEVGRHVVGGGAYQLYASVVRLVVSPVLRFQKGIEGNLFLLQEALLRQDAVSNRPAGSLLTSGVELPRLAASFQLS